MGDADRDEHFLKRFGDERCGRVRDRIFDSGRKMQRLLIHHLLHLLCDVERVGV